MENKSILHLDLDTFFVSVERLKNDDFIGKPILIGGVSDRGVVASCSYEARAFGISSAMPMRMARQLCPEAIVIRGDMESYSYYSKLVTEIIRSQVPLFEKSSIDEFYVDLSGMDKYFGCYKWATELRQQVTKETGLPLSFGLSINKTVSKIATGQAKPNGKLYINQGEEKSFLSPLSIRKIPMVGQNTYQLLRSMGVAKIKTLQAIQAELMERVLGKVGVVIWQKANGIDHSPVEPYYERKSISTERTFDQDTIDLHKLNAILVHMTEELTHKLRKTEKVCGCIAVKIRYTNFDTHTKQLAIPYTSADHQLIPVAKRLLQQVFQRRLRIRLIGVRLSKLVQGTHQIHLFDDQENMLKLYQAMDHLKQKFGTQSVVRAASLGMRFRDFNPFKGDLSE